MLGEKKLFLLDIDGTICKGNQLIEGAAKFLRDIKECDQKCGRLYLFFSEAWNSYGIYEFSDSILCND